MLPATSAHRIIDHPLAAHHLAVLRDRRSGPEQFRAAARSLAVLLGVEAAQTRLYGNL